MLATIVATLMDLLIKGLAVTKNVNTIIDAGFSGNDRRCHTTLIRTAAASIEH